MSFVKQIFYIHYANWQSDSVLGVTQESIGFGLLRSAIG